MKVFKIECGETEYVCHTDLLSALKWYLNFTDMNIDDIESIDEVLKRNWKHLTIVDTDAATEEDGEYPVKMTFAEYMSTAKEPGIIATSNY